MIEALERIEGELVKAANRRHAKRQRRGHAARLAVAAAVICLGVVSAASAISGVGPVPSLRNEAPNPLRPVPQGEGTQLSVQGPNGESVAMRGFRGGDRSLCVEAPPRPAPDASGVCAGYDALASAFERRGLILNVGGPETGDMHVLYGLVRADAKSIDVIDQSGREQAAKMSSPWATAKPGDGRAPDGISQAPTGTGKPLPMQAFMLASTGPYPTDGSGVTVRVTLADGHVLKSAFPSDYTP